MGYENYLTGEDKLHKCCIDYLRLQYPKLIWMHSPNEGKRSRFECWKHKYLGGGKTKGFPDIIIFNSIGDIYKGFAIEFKIKPNKTTPEQDRWLQDLGNCGFHRRIIYNFDDFKELIDDCYKFNHLENQQLNK